LQNSPNAHKPFVCYEFLSDELVRWLPNVINLSHHDTVHPDEEGADHHHHFTDIPAKGLESIARMGSTSRKKDEQQNLKLHPRYLAGQIFSPDFFGTLLGRMYYLPATIEVMEAIVMPSRRGQKSFFWQTSLPKDFAGAPYRDLVRDYCRRSDSPPAIPVALYRHRSTHDVHCYIVSNPKGDTVLRQTDQVIWLGAQEFGDHVHRQGILKCSAFFKSDRLLPSELDKGTNGDVAPEMAQLSKMNTSSTMSNGDVSQTNTKSEKSSMVDLHYEVLTLNQRLHEVENRLDAVQDQSFQISRQVEVLPAKVVSLFEGVLAGNRANKELCCRPMQSS
jgi:hypothetical protein